MAKAWSILIFLILLTGCTAINEGRFKIRPSCDEGDIQTMTPDVILSPPGTLDQKIFNCENGITIRFVYVFKS